MNNNVIINKLIVPTFEVMAKVVSNPSIEVVSRPDIWNIIGSVAAIVTVALLVLINITTALFWLKEHVWLNMWNRYKVDDSRCSEWIFRKDIDVRYHFMINTELFIFVGKPGAIYSFCLINKGTTDDFIYRAELDNNKGTVVDISIGHILKGSDFHVENLPHRLVALQGEVWFVAVENENFVDVSDPTLIIYTAAGKYRLRMDPSMFYDSIR